MKLHVTPATFRQIQSASWSARKCALDGIPGPREEYDFQQALVDILGAKLVAEIQSAAAHKEPIEIIVTSTPRSTAPTTEETFA